MDTRRWLAWHQAMVMSRTLETYCIELFPHWYASVGEEAVLVGTFADLRETDIMAPHYRGLMITFWMRGMSLKDIFGGILCRKSSVSKGRMSGLHAGPIARGVLPYVNNVLGPPIPTATGMAFAFKYRGEDRVAVVAFGDGTTGLGEFHETMNLGNVLKVPVVYVCQNNQYSISTPAAKGLSCKSIADWASRYQMPAEQVDGNDVVAVAAAVARAVEYARAGNGPSFVEALTYRRSGHFASDPGRYRPEGELAAWEQRDPIAVLEARLVETGVEPATLAAVWTESRAAAELAAAEARTEGEVDLSDLGLDEVYERAY